MKGSPFYAQEEEEEDDLYMDNGRVDAFRDLFAALAADEEIESKYDEDSKCEEELKPRGKSPRAQPQMTKDSDPVVSRVESMKLLAQLNKKSQALRDSVQDLKEELEARTRELDHVLEQMSAVIVGLEFSETERSDLAVEECVICLSRPPETVLLDCGHVCCCMACANLIYGSDSSQVNRFCPKCRSRVKSFVKVFF